METILSIAGKPGLYKLYLVETETSSWRLLMRLTDVFQLSLQTV